MKLLLPLTMAMLLGGGAMAQDSANGNPGNLAGAYLAARHAAIQNDFSEGATYFLRSVGNDPDTAYLQDSALVALISAGDMDRAVELTRQMRDAGHATELATLTYCAALAKAGDWQALLETLPDAGLENGDPDLLYGLLRGWALLGAGRASDAEAEFIALRKIRGTAPVVNYHLALAKAYVGDFEGAEALLAQDGTGRHILGLTARAEVLSQLDRDADALRVFDEVTGIENEPTLARIIERLDNGETLPFDVVKSPTDGIAQVFLTFASAMIGEEEPDPLVLIHARLASWLAPDLGEVRLALAQLLQSFGQFDLAEHEYDAMRQMGEIRPTAELARIDALARADRYDDAEKAAVALTATRPDLASGWVALGDLLRQQEKFAAAVPAYDKAIELIPEADPQVLWFPLYARGIAEERSGQWDRAEADFRAALELRPDHPQILNYLGYSYLDRNENLDEALELVRRASELRPDDGYITDSLAWAYYRLGRYEEAVDPMERAVAAMSQDPLVNDHLGDIYWKVGRKREAVFQWKRALNFGPEKEEEALRIRAKLDRGLDAVLAEEAANGGKLPMPASDPQPGE